MVSQGFEKGKASPCNFFHPERKIATTVHGDDFTSTGPESELKWLDRRHKAKFEVKTEFLGPGRNHVQQVRVLNRVLTWHEDEITYEADPRHAEILIKAVNVARAVSTSGSRDDAAAAGPPSVTTATTTPIPPRPDNQNGEDWSVEMQEIEVCKEYQEPNEGALAAADASVYRALAARAN